ncbi:HAD-IA family hydrolase [Methanomassiliicoccales archaeon LGM-DZ1]|nr:HAD-IA family hydrolase [Methanomassiliicoccales archaeon LGM-DZ1]
MDRIDFVLTGDRNYVDQIVVTCTSILANLDRSRRASFHLFMRDINPDYEKRLLALKKFRDCDIEIYSMEQYEKLFADVDITTFHNSYINIVCYYRLLIFKILPETVHKVFYVDGDMIINTDLAPIYDGLGKSLFAAVVEIYAMDKREEVLAHVYGWDEYALFVKDPMAAPYFNAGFFLVDLDQARSIGLWSSFRRFFDCHPNPPFADQDILNATIGQANHDKVKFLPPHYNVFCDFNIDYSRSFTRSYYPSEQIADSFRAAKIMHYAGGNKPWNYCNCHYYREWWQYAAMSPAAGSLLLKSQDVHAEISKELGYTKAMLAKSMAEVSAHRSKKFRDEYASRIFDKDPIIRYRFKRYNREKHSIVSKLLTLKRFEREAAKQINTDHYIDYRGIQSAIDRCEVVSFDFFDTLAIRPFVRPTDIFTSVEISSGKKGFAAARINAERECRAAHPDDEEVTLDQIYDSIPAVYRLLKDAEKEAEIRFITPNPVLKLLFDYAADKGKRIVIISDMYLPKETVQAMIDKCGYGRAERLYISSDLMKTKLKGTLFQYAIEDLGIRPSGVVHIGDNLISDCRVPKKMGIKAFWVTKNIDALLETDCRMRPFIDSNPQLDASVLLAVASLGRARDMDYWERFGYLFAGPVVTAYVNWLYKSIRKDGFRTVYFVARDGYTLQRIFDMLSGGKVESHYFYAPRHISNICNGDLEEKMASDRKEAEPAVKAVYDYYCMETGAVPEDMDYESKEAFLRAHSKELRNLADKKRKEYSEYVSSLSDDSRIALVDTITIHFSSQKLLSRSLPGREVKGYYWASIDNGHNRMNMEEFLHETFQREHAFKTVDWDVMEFFITSPEAPIEDVRDGKPVYKERNQYEQVRSEVYPLVSKGIVEYAEDYAAHVPEIWLSCDTVLNYLNNLCRIPTEVDKELMKKIKHGYDSEHTQYVPIFKQWFK